jgi:hypothetical protein
MVSRIFPKAFDNTYRGHWAGLWLLVPIVILRLIIGTNSMLNTHDVAMKADAIPLDTFPAAAVAAAVSLFSLLGLYVFVLGLLGVLVLIRYRAMIPFYYVLLLAVQLANRALSLAHPMVHSGGTEVGAIPVGSIVTWGLFALLVVGLILSLSGKGYRGA